MTNDSWNYGPCMIILLCWVTSTFQECWNNWSIDCIHPFVKLSQVPVVLQFSCLVHLLHLRCAKSLRISPVDSPRCTAGLADLQGFGDQSCLVVDLNQIQENMNYCSYTRKMKYLLQCCCILQQSLMLITIIHHPFWWLKWVKGVKDVEHIERH